MEFFRKPEVKSLSYTKNSLPGFSCRCLVALGFLLCGLLIVPATGVAYTIEPITWNVIGLDSNSPGFGPNRFPVGARVCGGAPETTQQVDFTWDRTNPYVDLTPNSIGTFSKPLIVKFGSNGCADAFFEVTVTQTSAAFSSATNLPAQYHISVPGASTPIPRELYVERLVSQGRNYIQDLQFGTSIASLTSVPTGGSFSLTKGGTYYIRLVCATATQGYEQLESFTTLPNTVFQILSVNSTYTAPAAITRDKLYADGCIWDNDPNSPNYLSCLGSGKMGGSITVTYEVKIIDVLPGPQFISSLIHDFSGSSFHYNSDYMSGARYVNLIDPAAITIAKNFSPDPNNVNGVSSLTFTLHNPNSGPLSGITFTDVFPSLSSTPTPAPGNMTLANTLTANTCGGTIYDADGDSLNIGDGGIKLDGAMLPANGTCSIQVNVTTSSTGIYNNKSGNVFVGSVDTGKTAEDSLQVNTDPPAGTGVCSIAMASWAFPAGFSTASPAPSVNNITTATARPGAGIKSTVSTTTSTTDGTNSWGSDGNIATGTTLTTSNDDYFEFALNTSGLSKIYLSFYARRAGTNGAKGVAVYYSNQSDNNAPEQNAALYLDPTVLSGGTGWVLFDSAHPTPGPGVLPIPVTANTTYIRIYGYNAGNSNTSSDVYIDDVTFTGCGAPIPPTITKTFSPATIAGGGTSSLIFTLNNPNTAGLTGATFSDTLPTGMRVATPLNYSTTCTATPAPTWSPASGETTLNFGQTNGADIPEMVNGVNGTCTAQVNVTAPPGAYSNTSGFLSTTESGLSKTSIATATLIALSPPAIASQFAPNPIFINGTATLTFTLSNPNQGSDLSNVGFSNTLPVGLTVSNGSTTVCGGTLTTTAPRTITFSNGTLAADGSCTLSTTITAMTEGEFTNISDAVFHELPVGSKWYGNPATAMLQVETPNPAISLIKQVSNTATGPWSSYLAVATGASVYVRYTVENLGDVVLSSVGVSDAAAALNNQIGGCTWYHDIYDGNPATPDLPVRTAISLPLSLPVAAPEVDSSAACVIGPITVFPAGTYSSEATATGSFTPMTVTDTSKATYATSTLTFSKHASEAYFYTIDDVLHYTYSVNNTGSAYLVGPLTITDNKIGTVTCPAITTTGNRDINLDPGESLTCTATYLVTAADIAAGEINNIARAFIDGKFSPTASESVQLAPDLIVTKTNNVSGNAATNTPFIWTLTVSNTNSSGASAIFSDDQTLLTDNLPTSGATYSAPAVATNAGGATGVISCIIATSTLNCTATGTVSIPPGGSFNIAVTTTPTVAGSLVNPKAEGICRVDPNAVQTERNESNNDASNTVTIVTPAVTLIKTANKTSFVSAGEVISYSYTVRNTGAATLAGPVTVVDNKTTVICPAVTTAIVFTTGLPGNGNANLDSGEQITCTGNYTILAADVTARLVTNTAIATVGGVNSPQVSLTVPIGPDLSVKKISNVVGAATPGSPFNWILEVTNAATAGAAATFSDGQLLLTDTLPNLGATYSGLPTNATNNGGTSGTINCSIDASSDLTCTASGPVAIPPGGSFSIAVTVTPTTTGSLDNPRSGGICRVDSATLLSETDESNNDCANQVTVGRPSLMVIKSSSAGSAKPGALIEYTVHISNSGPVIAKNVKIEDFPGRYSALKLNPYGNGTPFNLIPMTSGLTSAGITVQYSDDTDSSDGIDYGYSPAADISGCDGNITTWQVIMGESMQPAPSQFMLQYQVKVK